MPTKFFLAGWGWRMLLGVTLILMLFVILYTLFALITINAGAVV